MARTCIERRKAAIAGLEWDIVPTKEATKAYQTDNGAYRDFGERRSEAVKFFKQPDPDYYDFESLLSALLEQVFVFDALSLVLSRSAGAGWVRAPGLRPGLPGLIDGREIRPLLGFSGEGPVACARLSATVPPGRAPMGFRMGSRMAESRRAGLKGYEGAAFLTDQLMYLPVYRAGLPLRVFLRRDGTSGHHDGPAEAGDQFQYYYEVPSRPFHQPWRLNMTPTQIRELRTR